MARRVSSGRALFAGIALDGPTRSDRAGGSFPWAPILSFRREFPSRSGAPRSPGPAETGRHDPPRTRPERPPATRCRQPSAPERRRTFPRELFRKAGELEYLGLRYDPAWGGSGLDYWYTGISIEELMRGRNVGVVVGLMVQCEIATSVIHAYGSDELKREWLGPAIRGEKIAALGITEPGAGSNVAGIRTRAHREGDVKVMAHSSDTAELFFEDCRVPVRNLVGPQEGQGFYQIMSLFQGERLVLSYITTSFMREILEATLQYAREREVFGSKIAELAVWRHRLADLMTQLEAARLLTYRATDLVVSGDPEAETAVSMAKLFASELFKRLAAECDQLFGGYGCMEEFFVARATGGISGFAIGAGTSEIMREIIARRRIGP